ncbi:MAG: hypothetical protein RLZ14_740 [Actinomycetota bacterium]
MNQPSTELKRYYSTTPWRRNLSIPVLVGLTGIADLTGKGNPAVVANWRTRLQGFPPARIADKHPKFDLVEVLEWYRDQGPRTSEFAPITMRKVWPLLVRGFQASASMPSPREAMTSLVLLHSLLHNSVEGGARRWFQLVAAVLETPALAADAPLDPAELLVTVAHEVERHDPRAEGLLVQQLTFEGADVGYACDLIDALDQLDEVDRREVLWPILRLDPDRTRSLRVTGRRLAGLMVSVAGVPQGGSVLDPACGEGELLLECAQRMGTDVSLFGQEVDRGAWRIARSQMLILGVEAHLGAAVADSLRDPLHVGATFDAVVVDPPLGADAPALDRWIEFGFRHLKPGGRVVVALPLNELVHVKSARRSPDRRMVSAVTSLAEAGFVEGVLVTPPRLRGDVVGPMAVFAFSQRNDSAPGGDQASVAMVQLQAEPNALLRDGVIDEVAAQFQTEGFQNRYFQPPLEARRVPPQSLLRALAHLVEGVGSRNWPRSSASPLASSKPPSALRSNRTSSVWRQIATAADTEMSAIEAMALPVPSPARSPEPSDPFELLQRAQTEVLRRARQVDGRYRQLDEAARELLAALDRSRADMPAEVADRLARYVEELRRQLDGTER